MDLIHLGPSVVVVVGVDPGDSTGLVSLHDGVLVTRYQGPPALALDRLEGELQWAVAEGHRIRVACERYVQRQGPGVHLTHQPTALVVTGRVQALVERYGVELELQNPADAKRLAPDTLLRELSLRVTASQVGCRDANDVNDATRHALLCLATHHATLFDRLLRTASATRQ